MIPVLGAIRSARGSAPVRRTESQAVGALLSYDSGTYLASVSLFDGEPVTIPATPSTYTGVSTVFVDMDPVSGRPLRVSGPASTSVELVPPTTPPETSTTVVRGVVVGPYGSGTWRVDRGAWDRWNDAGDVYQAGSASSGTLYGLAWFGSQFTYLGASSILKATLRMVSNGSPGAGDWTATVQGCASGSRPAGAPAFTGSTVTVSVPSGSGGVATVDLDSSMRTGLRTGALKSFGLNSGTYGGTKGVGSSSWTITLDYEVTG